MKRSALAGGWAYIQIVSPDTGGNCRPKIKEILLGGIIDSRPDVKKKVKCFEKQI